MDAEGQAREIITTARTLAVRGTQLSVVIFAALLISWLSDFEPKVAVFRDAIVAQRRASRQASAFEVSNLPEKTEKLRNELLESERKSAQERNAETKQQLKKEQEYLRDELDRTIKTYQNSLSAVQNSAALFEGQRRLAAQVKFKFFGLEFGVGGLWAPLVWLAFFVMALGNLALTRRAVWKLLFRSLKTLKTRTNVEPGDLIGIAGYLPIWLAPSPTGLPASMRRTELRQTVFFSFSVDWLSYVCVGMAFFCVYLAIHLFGIAVVAPSFMRSSNDFFARVLYPSVACLLFCSIVVSLCTWIFPLRLIEKPGNRSPVFLGGRRELIEYFGLFAIGFLAFPKLQTIRRTGLLNPRFRKTVSGGAEKLPVAGVKPRGSPRFRTKHKVALDKHEEGFYQDSVTTLIHYVPLEGYAHSLRAVPKPQLTVLSKQGLNPEQFEALHPAAVLPWLRQYTKNRLKDKDYDSAHIVLMRALMREQQSYIPVSTFVRGSRSKPHINLQIYDLVANLALYSRRRQHLKGVLDIVDRIGIGYQGTKRVPVFRARAEDAYNGSVAQSVKHPRRFSLHRFISVLDRFHENEDLRQREEKVVAILKKLDAPNPDSYARVFSALEGRVKNWARIYQDKRFWQPKNDYYPHVVRQRRLHRRNRINRHYSMG